MASPKPLILASASATRKRMLTHAGVVVDTFAGAVDEEAIKESLMAGTTLPRDIADCLAEAKARSVSAAHPDRIVLGADQVLVQGGRVFSKAQTVNQAHEILCSLSGKTHQLISAAVIYDAGQPVWRAVSSANLSVRPLSNEFIDDYLAALGDDAFWSVGCYQVEGLGAQLFNKIDGDYYTILGLPLLPVLDFLRGRGMVLS